MPLLESMFWDLLAGLSDVAGDRHFLHLRWNFGLTKG